MPKAVIIPTETRDQPIPSIQTREISIDRADLDPETRELTLSFSSESPVDRFFGKEILDHKRTSVRMDRLAKGGALLLEHDRGQQIGVVTKASISGKRGMATVKFSKSSRAQEVFEDVKDGIRQSVSVSYRLHKLVMESEDETGPTFRVMDWEPLEVSLVSVPADINVGVGRDAQTQQPPTVELSEEMKMQRSIHLDPQPANRDQGGGGGGNATATPPYDPAADRKAEADRVKEIRETGRQFDVAELADEAVEKGTSIHDFRALVLQEKYKGVKPIRNEDPNIGMSQRDVKRYSLVRAIATFAEQGRLDGFEKECHDAVAKMTGRKARGFFVPHDVMDRSFEESKDVDSQVGARVMDNMLRLSTRALQATVGTAGGFTVGEDLLSGSMIELLRNRMVVTALGARSLSGLMGNVAIPKHTGSASTFWVPESGAITASQQTLGQIGLVPHTVGALTAYSKQLLAQSSIDVEGFVRQDLVTSIAIERDRAALNGSGAIEPLGLILTTGVNSVTFGAAPTWAKVVEFETEIAKDNADVNTMAYLTTPAVRGKWKTTVKEAGQATYLWETNTSPVNGYRAEVTNQVPSDKVLFGDWSQMLLADWAGLDIVVDPFTLAANAEVRIIVHQMVDNAVRHPESFAVSSDSGAQ